MTQPDIFDLLAEDQPRRRRRTPCPDCGYLHSRGDVTTFGSFWSTVPIGYRATYPGAPIRSTRTEAAQDMCDHHRTTTERNDR